MNRISRRITKVGNNLELSRAKAKHNLPELICVEHLKDMVYGLARRGTQRFKGKAQN